MQENGTEQPKVYRCTMAMLKIRSTPTEGKQTAQMKEWMTESRKLESSIPAIPNMIRDSVHKNSQENTSSDSVQLPLPRLDLPKAGQNTPYTPGSRKSTRKNFGKPAKSFSNFLHVKTL